MPVSKEKLDKLAKKIRNFLEKSKSRNNKKIKTLNDVI